MHSLSTLGEMCCPLRGYVMTYRCMVQYCSRDLTTRVEDVISVTSVDLVKTRAALCLQAGSEVVWPEMVICVQPNRR